MKDVRNKCGAMLELCRMNQPFLEIPFAGTAAFLSCDTMPDRRKLICVFVAVIAGFMSGNAFNGILDRKIDMDNPRTRNRPLADGRLTVAEAYAIMIASAIVVVISTGLICVWYIFLLPIPLGLAWFYSCTKRFTWFCHIIFGITVASVPVGSWIVFRGWGDWRAVLFGAVVFFWTVGFELIYSSQDVIYDKFSGMKSIPSVFGIHMAYRLSLFCHIIMAVLLLLLMYVTRTGWIFFIGCFLAIMILAMEHRMIRGDNVTHAGKTFHLNQMFSMVLLTAAILERFVNFY